LVRVGVGLVGAIAKRVELTAARSFGKVAAFRGWAKKVCLEKLRLIALRVRCDRLIISSFSPSRCRGGFTKILLSHIDIGKPTPTQCEIPKPKWYK
jgi:hypothetical protein